MSKTVADRIEVGKSDLGTVFIHEFANQSETRFEVRAGNHTVVTTPSRERALEVANALAGVKAAAVEESVGKAKK